MPTGNHHQDTTTDPDRPRPPRRRTGLVATITAALVVVAAGCRRDMYDQPRYEVYEPSTSFRDGTSSRPQVEGTVARGDLRADAHLYQGKLNGKDVDTFPDVVDEGTLELGRERYLIYCSPCHGRAGDGRGMVVRRGFSPPPSFHTEYYRTKPVGHFFGVITNGYGAMYSYAARIPKAEDRWAIVAYIRALQYSRAASPADLTEPERKILSEAPGPGKPSTDDHRASTAEAPK